MILRFLYGPRVYAFPVRVTRDNLIKVQHKFHSQLSLRTTTGLFHFFSIFYPENYERVSPTVLQICLHPCTTTPSLTLTYLRHQSPDLLDVLLQSTGQLLTSSDTPLSDLTAYSHNVKLLNYSGPHRDVGVPLAGCSSDGEARL